MPWTDDLAYIIDRPLAEGFTIMRAGIIHGKKFFIDVRQANTSPMYN